MKTCVLSTDTLKCYVFICSAGYACPAGKYQAALGASQDTCDHQQVLLCEGHKGALFEVESVDTWVGARELSCSCLVTHQK